MQLVGGVPCNHQRTQATLRTGPPAALLNKTHTKPTYPGTSHSIIMIII